jgi:type II secretory pathway pseudopilin PulG
LRAFRPGYGFSMVEVTVVLVIILGLAALIAPGVIGRLDRSRVEASAESLLGLATAVHDPSRGGGSFKGHVGVYPGAVSHLTRQISTADANICGVAYTAIDSAGWNGPYLNRTAPATGMPIGIGVVRDTLTRDPVSGGDAPVLRIHVDSVAVEDAGALDVDVDGVLDAAAGTVRWGAVDGDGFVTIDYLLPVKEC